MEAAMLIDILFLFLALVLTIFVHEMGHLLVGRWCGMTVTSLGLGNRKPFFSRNFGSTRFFICWNMLAGGVVNVVTPRLFDVSWQKRLAIAAGLLANLVLAILAFALWVYTPVLREAAFFLFVFNLVMVPFNALPLRHSMGGMSVVTDGHVLLALMRGRMPSFSPSQHLSLAAAFGETLEAAADRGGVLEYALVSAMAWSQLGCWEAAKECYEKCDAEHLESLASMRALAAIVGCRLAIQEERFAEAEDAIAACRAFAQEVGDPDAAHFAMVLEVELSLARGAIQEAEAIDAKLQSQALSHSMKPFAALAHARLRMALEEKGGALFRWEDCPVFSTEFVSLPFLLSIAAHEEANRRIHGAHQASEAFLRAWELALMQLKEPALRARLIEAHRGHVLRALGVLGATMEQTWKEKLQLLAMWDGVGTPPHKSLLDLFLASFRRVLAFGGLSLFLFFCCVVSIDFFENPGNFSWGRYVPSFPNHRASDQAMGFLYASWIALERNNERYAEQLFRTGLEDPSALLLWEGLLASEFEKGNNAMTLNGVGALIRWRVSRRSLRLGYYWRGRVRLKTHQLAGALRDFKRVTELSKTMSERVDGKTLVALTLEKQKKYAQAIGLCVSLSRAKEGVSFLLKRCLPLLQRHKQHRAARILCSHTLWNEGWSATPLRACRTILLAMGGSKVEIDALQKYYTRPIRTKCKKGRGWRRCLLREWRDAKVRVRVLQLKLLPPDPTPHPRAQSTTQPTTQPAPRRQAAVRVTSMPSSKPTTAPLKR